MEKKTEPLNAETLMNSHVQTLSEDMLLGDAIDFLLKHKISCAPVVISGPGGGKSVVGILTEKDCMERLADEFYYGSPRPIQTVATSMKRHPLCVAPDTDVFSLITFFVSHGLRHAPVTDENGQLLGMISRREILRSLARYYDQNVKSWQLERFAPDLSQVSNLRYFKR
jgi:CBS domain-containing protein